MTAYTPFLMLAFFCYFQEARASVNVSNFEHTSSYSFESMKGARVGESFQPSETSLLVGIGYSFQRNPLVVENLAGTERVGVLIHDYQTFHLTGGYRFNDRLAVGLDSALVQTKFAGGGTDTGATDTRGSVDYTFWQQAKWAFSVQGQMTIPTGKTDDYLSDQNVGEALLLGTTHEWDRWAVSVNGGYGFNSKGQDSVDPRLDQRQRLILEVGVIRPITQYWNLIAEYHQQWTMPPNSNYNPDELYVGGRNQWTRSLAAFVGGSVGTIQHTTSNEWRVMAGLKWAPVLARPAVAAEPECEMTSPPDQRFVIHFANDKFSLDDQAELSRMQSVIKELGPNIEAVNVEGHTSITGNDAINIPLSQHRAEAIRDYLIARGEDGNFLHAEGDGARYLLDEGTTETAHAKNRRVEISIHQKASIQQCH